MSESKPALPYAGIRVVEFTHMVMGPTCGLLLGDLGAEVIKVEPIEGDNTRRLLGSGAGFFPTFNRNKKSIALDLKKPEGVEAALRLIATADIVSENFKPGTMKKLGLDYDRLHKRQRHHGRHVRRHRCDGGAAPARTHRQGLRGSVGAVREQHLPGGAAH